MSMVTSKDGTTIAYEKNGSGPALILVEGALGYRSFGTPELAKMLAPHFTVFSYDRRGRGESGDTKPFAVDREVEDIDALINKAGGAAFVYGISSGACLALEAALHLGEKIKKLAIYEPPYDSEEAAQPAWKEYRGKLAELIASNRRGDAVALFMRFVGAPDELINEMRQAPMWPMMESVAPTLMYDADAIGKDRSAPVKRAANLQMPVLIMDGGANLNSMPFMHATATTLTKAIPQAEHCTLENQMHNVDSKVLVPKLVEFFSK